MRGKASVYMGLKEVEKIKKGLYITSSPLKYFLKTIRKEHD